MGIMRANPSAVLYWTAMTMQIVITIAPAIRRNVSIGKILGRLILSKGIPG